MPLATVEVATPTSQSIEAGASSVCPLPAEAFLGQWTDTIGHNVLVVQAGEDKPDLLKAILTTDLRRMAPGGKPKELLIKMDGSLQRWRCGNGVLDIDRLVYDDSTKGQLREVSWINWSGKGSTWYREKSFADVAKKENRVKSWSDEAKKEILSAVGKSLKTGDSTADSPKSDKSHKTADSPKSDKTADLPKTADSPRKSWSDVAKAMKTEDSKADSPEGGKTTDLPKVDKKTTSSTGEDASESSSGKRVGKPRVPTANSVASGIFLGQWKAYWPKSKGQDVHVTCDGPQGLLKATMTTPIAGHSKELLIAIDSQYNTWRCGNGWLGEYIEYENDQAITLTWITWDGRVSTWNREIDHNDHSSTDAGTEENLKETWWNMTEEWETEKCAIKSKISKQVNAEAYEEEGKRDQWKATRSSARSTRTQWKEVTEKNQKPEKTSKGASKDHTPSKTKPSWREVGAWKPREGGKGGRRQQKA